MKKTAVIVYFNFYDATEGRHRVGGVETYIHRLCRLCLTKQFRPVVVQSSPIGFTKTVAGVEIIGVPERRKNKPVTKYDLFDRAKEELSGLDDVLVFGADHCSVPNRLRNTIGIQHGVFWDLDPRFLTRRRLLTSGLPGTLLKTYLRYQAVQNFNNSRYRVCVDYNFLNWYRTQVSCVDPVRVRVILNPTSLVDRSLVLRAENQRSVVRILFARRFTEYRGTRLFASAINKVIQRYDNVFVTVAGEGPDEKWLRTTLNPDKVEFRRYHPDEAMNVLLDHDIAVVPSLASEGTSLSVAEAMGAGRAIVACGVGGITNMIIHRHNGLLVAPTSPALEAAIAELVEHPAYRAQIGAKAYETASNSFGEEHWLHAWNGLLDEVAAEAGVTGTAQPTTSLGWRCRDSR